MKVARTLAAGVAACAALVQSASAASMAMGSYECWGNGEARLLMNFTVTGSGTYKGSDDSIGHFTLTGNRVNFTSGSLNGVMPDGFVANYVMRQGVPTVSFVGPSGAEAQFCEHVK
jgi:hypothetical protein